MPEPKPRRTYRCAIYTRKSSEEGLEQDFNSLQAQREACEAYVASQRHEGWKNLATAYDDGGFSGGSIERPALRQLLADIEAGQIDIVVVYKVDRLTRALSDFARIVEIFDRHAVSFVSVTQAFNTTTSMGRLTLNVLLSFAQFEREVTGERIRDKIAASKKKGLWMGGFVPLGYEADGRTLNINPNEAETIQTIFDLSRAQVSRPREAGARPARRPHQASGLPRIALGPADDARAFTVTAKITNQTGKATAITVRTVHFVDFDEDVFDLRNETLRFRTRCFLGLFAIAFLGDMTAAERALAADSHRKNQKEAEALVAALAAGAV